MLDATGTAFVDSIGVTRRGSASAFTIDAIAIPAQKAWAQKATGKWYTSIAGHTLLALAPRNCPLGGQA